MALTIQELKHDSIDPDPNNPRQIFDTVKLQELGTDLALRGMLQPIMVRPHPERKGRFMIVFGERRWRAAALVDMKTVPATVREMNDLDVLEAQVAENDKRSDVHPLEEADAFRRLHEDHGRVVEEIAELSGKSVAYVYASMKLCALVPKARELFLLGKLDKSRATLIARLPASQQAKAAGEIADQNPDEPTSYRAAAQHIRRNYMLRLADAPFKVGDGLLVEKAGPCTTCPKRTGNQQELFADVVAERGGADLCTDAKCYTEKKDAHWKRVKNEAEAAGKDVLEGRAAQQAGGYGDKKLLDLDECAHSIGEYDKTWRQLLGKEAKDAVSVVARSDSGEIKELITRSDLPKLMKEAGIKTKPNGRGESEKDRTERLEQQKYQAAFSAALFSEAAAGAKELTGEAFWRLLARMAVRVCRNEALIAMGKRLELQAEKQDNGGLIPDKSYSSNRRAAMVAHVASVKTVAELQLLTVQLLIAERDTWHGDEADDYGFDDDEFEEYKSNLEDAVEAAGVDVKALEKKVKADLAAAEKEKKQKKPPAAEAAS